MRYLRFGLSAALLIFFVFSSSAPALAARFINANDVNVTKPINDDVYISGGTISLDSTVNGDVVIMGGNVRVNGDITGDLFVAGGTVIIDGNVGHTARVGGGTVNIKNRIGRDLMVGAGAVVLGRESAVTGDVLAGSGSFEALGSIKGDVKGGFGNAELNGPVGGNVDISVDRLTIGRQAHVAGDLDYRSANRAKVTPPAVVIGKVTRHQPPQPKLRPVSRVFSWLWSLGSMLAVGLVIAWLFPASLKLTKESLVRQPWAALGIGLAAFILAPIVLLITVFTLIGIPLALIGLAVYVIAVYLAQIYSATAIGALVLDRGGEKWIGAGAALGIAVLSLVKLVPIAGGLVTFFLMLFGLGAMTMAAWQKRSSRP